MLEQLFAFFQTPTGVALLSTIGGAISVAIGNSERFGGEKWKWLRKLAALLGKKSAPVLIAAAFLGLAFVAPAAEAKEPPAFGCNTGGCNFYLLEYDWPNKVTINVIDFVVLKFSAGKDSAHVGADVNYLGFICRGAPELPPCMPDAEPEVVEEVAI